MSSFAFTAQQQTLLTRPIRNLALIFGDQLNHDSALFCELDPAQDLILMQEVAQESAEPLSSWSRTVLFLSAMRHFAEALVEQNWPLLYLKAQQSVPSLAEGVEAVLAQQKAIGNQPHILAVLPGDAEVKQTLDQLAKRWQCRIDWRADRHFLAEEGEFSAWLAGKKQPRMEYWYRHLRQRLGILMTENANGKQEPIGGSWNLDHQNRRAFDKSGPSLHFTEPQWGEDKHCMAVIEEISALRWPLAGEKVDTQPWLWPLNRSQAQSLLAHFIEHKLPYFGDYQDAMWLKQPFLFHARLATALNLKLLNPREVEAAAETAYHQGHAPLNAVEGFIRQIVGWREYVRGLYWSHRAHWLSMNALNAQRSLPAFYWHGKTQMVCLAQSVGQVLQYGYGHHIQRLMVTGLFSLLYGVKPQAIHAWYLGMFVDAVAWVEVPNTLGMSQFADGGMVGSKPYIASGAYIQKMSNYCQSCRYHPKEASSDRACPFTTLYWHFIAQHPDWIAGHPRLGMQWKNWHNKKPAEQQAIHQRAQWLFDHIEII
ncbi:MAG: cryptochrome/photolyase family protein [Thiotrichales bacterium]|nr:cryptochrome/photolyase family protein [Thiotrichales bacterium]